MLDPKLLRQNLSEVAERLKDRGMNLNVAKIQALEEQRKNLQSRLQELQNEKNTHAKSVGLAKAKGENVDALLQQVKDLGDTLKSTEEQFTTVQSELDNILVQIPNLPHPSVPKGKSEEDNQVIRTWGEVKKYSFTPKDHVDLGEKLGMDFSAAAKLSGARFVVLHGALARIHRAIAQFMLDLHIKEHGYQEVSVP
ncbi:MAG: serine--tRNA ligase, partial [Gammaproteobacteria bacterium]|nr:serine--tRNA ligase [Gammaproteobacteria bacterium]